MCNAWELNSQLAIMNKRWRRKNKKRTEKMRKTLVLAIVAGVMWISSAEVCAVDYYVDATDGSDSWNGNYPSYEGGVNGPWKTIISVIMSEKTYLILKVVLILTFIIIPCI